MELIDRYLQAVGSALPKSQRDDIVKELSDSILSQVEEREAGLGRPLTEDEQVELLKKLGKPEILASRYRNQQALIAPTVLPIYWKVLKAALGLAFLVEIIAAITMAAAGRPLFDSMAPIFHYPGVALTVFGWVTLTFAALHFFGAKFQVSDQWDPRKLPPIVKVERKKGRVEAIAALVIGALATVWWLVGLRNPWLIMGPGVAFWTFGPVWLKLYPLFVVLGLAEVARHTLELVRPYATKLHTVLRLGIRAVSLIVLFFLIKASDVFVASNGMNAAHMQPVVTNLNYAIRLGLLVAAVISVVKLGVDVWKLLSGKLDQAQQAALG